MLRILLADDHAIVRRGLKQVLTEGFGQVVLGEVSSGQGVIDAVHRHDWHAVILDINLPDKNGVAVLKEIRAMKPDLLVVMLSMHSEEQYAVRAFKAGASGYLTKESAPEELITAMRHVLRGGKYVNSTLGELLVREVAAEAAAPPHQQLSDREYEVMMLIARGMTVKEAADHLSLSVKTISTYRARLLKKLQLKNTADLIRYSFEHRLMA